MKNALKTAAALILAVMSLMSAAQADVSVSNTFEWDCIWSTEGAGWNTENPIIVAEYEDEWDGAVGALLWNQTGPTYRDWYEDVLVPLYILRDGEELPEIASKGLVFVATGWTVLDDTEDGRKRFQMAIDGYCGYETSVRMYVMGVDCGLIPFGLV